MIPLMLEVCPELVPQWETFLEEWKDEPQTPLYNFIYEIVDFVDSLLDSNKVDRLTKVFSIVERWHLDGEHYVREAATIGFLEGIISWTERDQRYERYFGSETARFWKKLNDFWSKGIIIVDD